MGGVHLVDLGVCGKIIATGLKKVGCEGLDWIHVAEIGSSEHGGEHMGSMKCG
jgi:hypothetical protein